MAVQSKEFKKALLKSKYNWTGKSYRVLMGKIVKEANKNIAQTVLKYDKKKYEKVAPKTKRGKKLIMPDVSVIIKNSPTVLKAATQGELLANSLREKLRKDIKRTLLKYNITTTNGLINKTILKKMEKQVAKTFASHKKAKQPNNIKTIATTETMNVINNVRFEYAKAVSKEAKQNGFTLKKKWVHNPKLSKEPRPLHITLGETEPIGINDWFVIDGKKALTPHDSRLPAEETINCHCELDFRFVPI